MVLEKGCQQNKEEESSTGEEPKGERNYLHKQNLKQFDSIQRS